MVPVSRKFLHSCDKYLYIFNCYVACSASSVCKSIQAVCRGVGQPKNVALQGFCMHAW